MINVTVEANIRSSYKRQVQLEFILTNNDDVDYYYNPLILESDLFSSAYIGNTRLTRKANIPWEECHIFTCLPSGTTAFSHIPAQGTHIKDIDIISKCLFLLGQPLGYTHILKYEVTIDLPVVLSPGSQRIATIKIPKVELPFVLIDVEERAAEELIGPSRASEIELSGAVAAVGTEL